MSENQNNIHTTVKILKEIGKRLAGLWLAVFLVILSETAQAGPYYWNPAQNGTAPSDGGGGWDDVTVSNWWDGASQTFAASTSWGTAGTNVIIGAGVPGVYGITNLGTVYARTLTFSNANGYTISGGQVTIYNGPFGIMSLSNSTNTIAAPFSVANNTAISNAANSALILAGGGLLPASPFVSGVNENTSLVKFGGGDDGAQKTYNMASTGTFLVNGARMDITNAILNVRARLDVGRLPPVPAANINVFNDGQLNQNSGGGANDSGRHLQISRGGPATLNVYSGGLVSTIYYSGGGNNNSVNGKIRLVPDSSSQGALNVFGGKVLVGCGPADYGLGAEGVYGIGQTLVTFFDSSPTVNATTRAVLNLTGGSLTAYGIQLNTTAGINTSPTNGISVTGGALYLGPASISYPVGGMGTNFFCNLSGGTVAGIQNWSPASSVPVNLTNVNGNITFQAADIYGSAFDIGFSGPLTGVGGFYKTGGGKLTLTGANNYSGTTVVSNGTLVISTIKAPTNGAVAVEGAGATVGPVYSVVIAGNGQTLTLNGNMSYNSGTPTADFNFSSFLPSATVPSVQVNGNLAFNVTPSVTVEGNQIPAGVFPLIKYTGTYSGFSSTSVSISQAGTSGYITNDAVKQTIELVVTSSTVSSPLTWSVGSGLWGTNLSLLNWDASGISVAYSDAAAVQFDDTASGSFPITITVTNTVIPTNLTVAAANDYIIQGSGVIAGSEGLIKSGNGSLTLSGTNTYSGGTTITAGGGTVNINYGGDGNNNSAIGTGSLTLNTAAKIGNTSGDAVTLLTPITQNWNDDWTYVGANDMNLGVGAVTLGNGEVVLTVVTNTLEVGGVIGEISANSILQKQGAGTLVLSNFNTFTGGVKANAGVLGINADGALGTGPLVLDNGTIDNTSGSDVVLITAPSSITMKSFTFLGTTNLDLGAGTVTVPASSIVNISNNTLTINGAILGANTFINKNGSGALKISGSANSGGANFVINGGVVYANRNAGFVAIGQPGLTINSNGTLVILNPTGTQLGIATAPTPVNLNGGLLELNGSTPEYVFNPTFNSGILRNSGSAAVLDVRNGLSGAAATTNGTSILGGKATFDITSGSSLTILGTMGGTATNAALIKTGGGALILTNNSYAGNTVVSNGILSLAYPNLSTNSTVTIAGAGVLDLNFTNTVNTTNTISALVVNGVSQPEGLYNSNSVSYITSGGSLLVVPPLLVNPNPGPIQFSFVGNTLTLSWPTNLGWILQTQTNSLVDGLNTNWVDVSGSTEVTSTNVTINPDVPTSFYRLKSPY